MIREDRTSLSSEEYGTFPQRFSNWGRWGAVDELGTLNHITPEVTQAAAGLVKDGLSISIGRPIETRSGPTNPYPAHYFKVIAGAGGPGEFLGMFFHGHVQTHLDSLSHIRAFGRSQYYNGVDVGDGGLPVDGHGSVHHWRNGIATRGVLYDIPRLRGTAYVEPGRPVQRWELQDAALAQGLQPRRGDAVLIRCGLDVYLATNPGGFATESDGNGLLIPAGVHASTLEFLFETDAALLCWDMLDAPTSDQGIDNPSTIVTPLHLHQIAIPYMGLPLIDNANFEHLAQACEQAGRWEFLFLVLPLIIEGGTGSPVNPVAVF